MSTPMPPRRPPAADPTEAPSARRDVDETAPLSEPAPAAPPAFGPPAAHGEVGTLGPYRLVRQLGRGGMGAVYAAIDTRLDRRLALKLMLPEFAADPAARDRFVREARAAAKVSHDNVVTVYEADVRDGVPYIAMQYLEGYPLDQYLKKKGNPTLPQVLRIARDAAAGLAAAHRTGLVHRDVKPGNLWLEAPHGRVKVLDFGLARPVDADGEITKQGAVVGTPAFMSPEQARGQKVDGRTDLFSLGVVLYRLCTGRLPFHGPTTMAVLMALASEEPPPVRAVNPAVPEPLADLIHQLLAKNADDRPKSADEVVARLRAMADPPPKAAEPQVVYVPIQVTAVPDANPFADLDVTEADPIPEALPAESPRKPRGPTLAVAAGLAALVLMVFGGVVIVTRNRDGTETKIEVPDGRGKTLASVGPGGKAAAADTSADRKAAERVLALGGFVQANGNTRDIKAREELPKERFSLTCITLDRSQVTDAELADFQACQSLAELYLGSTKVTDAGLAAFKGCKTLTRLRLARTAATDTGLEHFKDCKNLTALDLGETRATDAGLAHFKDCKSLTGLWLNITAVTDAGAAQLKDYKKLTVLSLGGTKVSDAGLAHLLDLPVLTQLILADTAVTDAGLARLTAAKQLTHLHVQQTKVTPAGIAAFHAAVPGCRVEHDGGVIEAIDVDRQAAEWVFGIGGKVQVNDDAQELATAAGLPRDRFTLTAINLAGLPVADGDLVAVRHLRGLNHLILHGAGVTDTGLAALKGTTGLTKLSLNINSTSVTDAGLAHLKDVKGLAQLYLLSTKVSDAGLVHLLDLPGLTQLVLTDTAVTDAGLARLTAAKQLTYLNVQKTKVTAKGLAAFRAAVPGCRIEHDGGVIEPMDADRRAAERVLAFGGIVWIDGNLRDIKVRAELPTERFTLTGFNLRLTKVTDADLADFKECTQLTHLHLASTKVTDAGLVAFKHCKKLTMLQLAGTGVTDAGLRHFKDCESLKELFLYNTAVTDVGLAQVKDYKKLTTLSVVGTTVSDAGLAHVLDLPELTQLSLGAGVTDVGLARLTAAKQLTHLDIRGTQVTAQGMAAFHAAVPGCQIMHDGGVVEPKK